MAKLTNAPATTRVVTTLSLILTTVLQGSLDRPILKILSRRARLRVYALRTGIVEISGDVFRLEEEGWIMTACVRRSRVQVASVARRG
ncbi:MAG: hypothetical protein ACKV2U_08195 [Bryobacteraceae bacterium]